MNISTSLKDVAPAKLKAPGSYEWWYFDGISVDESYSFVVIFYAANPFSTRSIKEMEQNTADPEDFPAISISIYHQSKTIYYSYLEYDKGDFFWDEIQQELTIGKDVLQFKKSEDELAFTISLDQELPSGHSIKGNIEGRGGAVTAKNFNQTSEEQHFWNPLAPTAEIKVELNINGQNKTEFTGTGYADHNVGDEPLKESFQNWYWGRFHFKESTLIIYLMNGEQQEYKAWLLGADGKHVLQNYSEIETTYYSRSWFGLKSARKIILKSENSEMTLQLDDMVDSGPFYQRFLGSAILNEKNRVQVAKGISEYLEPSRIYAKSFWPLIHMRLRFVNKAPHWVQKSKRLYPWTW